MADFLYFCRNWQTDWNVSRFSWMNAWCADPTVKLSVPVGLCITWDWTTSGAPHGLLCLRLPVNKRGVPPHSAVSRLHKQAQIFFPPGTATLEKGDAAGVWWVVLNFKTLQKGARSPLSNLVLPQYQQWGRNL